MLLRAMPKTLVKLPPMRILPSGCTAVASITTSPTMLRLSVWSSRPSVSSRAMRLRVTAAPPFGESVVKKPPAKILPSACTAIEKTLTVRVRVERISQAGRGIEPGDAVARLSANGGENAPAKILPSACTAIARTSSFAFGLNESARPVVASSRAMLLRVCPPMLVKSPPAKILPSACTAIERTVAVRVRIERIRQAGGGIEPGDVVARLSADGGENAARQNLAVRLHRDGIDSTVRVRVERISQAGRGIEPGDAVARLPRRCCSLR